MMSWEFFVMCFVWVIDDLWLLIFFGLLIDYCGVYVYLVVCYDMVSDQCLDNVLIFNWFFDLVCQIDDELYVSYYCFNEFEKCLVLFQLVFVFFFNDVVLLEGVSCQYCLLFFNVGCLCYILLFLMLDNMVYFSQWVMEVGLLVGYILSMWMVCKVQMDCEMDLIECELECIYWIVEGKMSDEIVMIFGILKNMINNYIMSVMCKIVIKNWFEVIVYVVWNNFVQG